MTERLHFHFSLSCIGEGNGNPLQCSCLENLRDRGVWWAAIYGVAQSRTQLKVTQQQKGQMLLVLFLAYQMCDLEKSILSSLCLCLLSCKWNGNKLLSD